MVFSRRGFRRVLACVAGLVRISHDARDAAIDVVTEPLELAMQVDVEEINNALVITPRFQRLDAAIAPAFRDHVAPKITDRRLVVFAMGAITFMDSSGLGSLVALLKQLPAGGVIRLAEVSTSLERVLKLTRLDKVLQSFPTVPLAVA